MSVIFDVSQVYTRVQSDARYLLRPLPPDPPTFTLGTPVQAANKQTCSLPLTVTPPPTPVWATGLGASSFISSYLAKVVTPSTTFTLTLDPSLTTLEGFLSGVSYQISLASVDFLNTPGPFSAAQSFTAPADTNAPAAPSFLVAASATGALITVLEANSEADFAGYEVYRDTSSSLESNGSLLPCAVFSGASFEDVAIPVSGSYYYYLKALNYSGLSTDSAVVGPVALTASTAQPPAEILMAGTQAVANADGSITVDFPGSADNTITSYKVYRQTDPTPGFTLLNTLSPTASLLYTDTTAVPGLTYTYAITAVNPSGESAIDTSSPATATSRQSTPPAPIDGSTISYAGQPGAIIVRWTASDDHTTVGYTARYRYRQKGPYSFFGNPQDTSASSITLTDLIDPETGLPPTRDSLANEFEVQVATFDLAGNLSAFVSRMASGNPSPVEYPELSGYRPASGSYPPAPAFTGDTLNPNCSITLNWNSPGIGYLAGYVIEQLSTLAPAWVQIQTVTDGSSGAKTYNVTGLEPYRFRNNQYRFRIRTVDTLGNVSAVNLLDNPGFESSLSSWNYSVAPTLVGGMNGGSAVSLTTADALSQTVAVSGGSLYTFSAYLHQASVASSGSFTVTWLDGSSTVLGTVTSASLSTSTNWQRLILAAVYAPANAVSAKLTLLGGPSSQSVLWDSLQIEIGGQASPYGDGTSPWLKAVDTTGPNTAGYSPSFTLTPDVGVIKLAWVNATDSSFFNCTFEIWRKRTASSAPGFTPDSALVKLIEVPGTNDGKPNSWTDQTLGINNVVTATYSLRPRDQYGNALSDGGGNPTFVATASATSLDSSNIPITGGQITSGTITIGGTGAPVNLEVRDGSNTVVAELGALTVPGRSGISGGYFGNISLGGSSTSPNLWIDGTGNLAGSNGTAVDLLGNVGLKNTLLVNGTTSNPTLSTSWADLPELDSGNSNMTVACKGNPLLIVVDLHFNAQSSGGSTGPVSGISGLSLTSFTDSIYSGGGPPTIAISISGDGTGAGATVYWGMTTVGSNRTFTPSLTITGGSGYTTATATVTISNGNSTNGYTNGTNTYSCTITASSPETNQVLQCRVLMAGVAVLGPVQLTTDASGNARWNATQMLFAAAGNRAFRVQAFNQTGTYNIYSTSRSFGLVELG